MQTQPDENAPNGVHVPVGIVDGLIPKGTPQERFGEAVLWALPTEEAAQKLLEQAQSIGDSTLSCNKCGGDLPVAAFNVDRAKGQDRFGRSATCRECANKIERDRRKAAAKKRTVVAGGAPSAKKAKKAKKLDKSLPGDLRAILDKKKARYQQLLPQMEKLNVEISCLEVVLGLLA